MQSKKKLICIFWKQKKKIKNKKWLIFYTLLNKNQTVKYAILPLNQGVFEVLGVWIYDNMVRQVDYHTNLVCFTRQKPFFRKGNVCIFSTLTY